MSMFYSLLSSGGGGLPSGYQAVTCLRVTDATGSYVDINYPWGFGLRYEFDIAPILYDSNWTSLASCTYDAGSHRFGYNSEGKRTTPDLFLMFNSSSVHSNNIGNLDQVRHNYIFTLESGNSSAHIEGISTSVVSSATTTASGNIRLLAHGVGADRYRGNIYGIQIYSTSTNKMVVNLVPCIDKATSIAGFYDTIGKQFYTSNTSVPFEYIQ